MRCTRTIRSFAALSVAVAALVWLAPARAQQPAPAAKATTAAAPKAKSTTPGKPGEPSATPAAGEGGLRGRVESLEEQLVDMQVVIGTLESLAKSGGATAAAPPPVRSGSNGATASDAARLDGIETQIRALTAQVEQLAEQVRAQNNGRRSDVTAPRAPDSSLAAAPPPGNGFGATSVKPAASADPIGGLIANGTPPPPATPAPSQGAQSQTALSTGPPPPATAGTGGDDANPKQAYEAAYGYLLQQDYGAAETAFEDFLKRYPNDSLSGNAQYWLGESFFVRGQYKQAAGAFLKGYQTYGKSAKAPDSLLKLAMSLDRLGQKDAACSSYGELWTRFPTAPPHIKSRAQSERQRLGCA